MDCAKMTAAAFDRMRRRRQPRIVMSTDLRAGHPDSLAHVGEKHSDDVADKIPRPESSLSAERQSSACRSRKHPAFSSAAVTRMEFVVAGYHQPSSERRRQRLHQ